MGDSIKISARSVYMEDLDAKVAAQVGLHRGRVCVVGAVRHGRPEVTVFAEAEPGPWRADVIDFLRAELGPRPELRVVAGRPGLIKRTTSGKPRRRQMWEAFLLASGGIQENEEHGVLAH
jgi:fatty-acyl-CoA synthase